MRFRWYVELPQWLILAAMAAIAITAWSRVPLPMPVHWSGHLVDGFGGKVRGLLMWPAIALAFYLVLWLASRYGAGSAVESEVGGDAPAMQVVIAALYHLARIAALALIAIIYIAQVRFAEGHFFDMERINRYGLYAMGGITGLLVISLIYFARPRQVS